jgi:acyl dehydratase
VTHEASDRAPWLKVGDKLPAHSFGPFLRDDLAAYAAVSLDDNPLHLDDTIAARAGLTAPPVHGMLVMACFAPAIANWRKDLRLQKLAGKFVQPLICGDHVALSGRVVQVREEPRRSAVLRLMAHAGQGPLVVLAEATVVPHEDIAD